jgi:hypothetical protein
MPDVRMPDGTIIRNVPEGTTRAEIQARYNAARISPKEARSALDKASKQFQRQTANLPFRARQTGILKFEADPRIAALRERANDDSRVQGFLAGAVKPLDNLATWAAKTAPAQAIDRAGQAVGLPSVAEATAGNDKTRRTNTRTGYQLAGNIAGTIPTAYLPGGVLAQGAVGGALLSDDPNDLKGVALDAVTGAVAAKGGQQFGKRILAPAAERLGRTAPVRKVAATAAKVTGKKLLPGAPRLSTADKMVNKAKVPADQLRQNLDDAQRLGLPYALADADPRLRTLAGSAVRKSADARALAEQNLIPRQLGQADRAVAAIDDMLAPITNIEQRSGAIKTAAQDASRPFYEAARSQVVAVDDELRAMLNTPAGREALDLAKTIAANDGIDLGDLDKAVPFETLQMVKRGLDAKLSGYRNPITGKLVLEGNPEAQSVAGLVQRFNERLIGLSDDYAKGNAAYADVIRRREALGLGRDTAANNVPQREFDAALGRMDDATRPEMGRGYATSMADQVNRQRFSGNPYNAVYGSPLQQGKVGALFPEGADDFGRLYNLESDMAATARETLGGSPTALRAAQDQLFDGNAAADVAFDVVASGGVPSPTSAVRFGAGLLKKISAPRISEKKAAEIAPTLLGTDPKAALQFLDDLARKKAEAEARRRAYQQTFGMLSLPAVPLSNGGGAR